MSNNGVYGGNFEILAISEARYSLNQIDNPSHSIVFN
jgi:hypothetical protein